VADINSWSGILNFKNGDGLFSDHQLQMQQNLVPVLANMQQTLGGVAAWGLVPALPELAIASYCNSLPDLSRSLCNSLISTEGLSNACIHGSGLMLFGKDVCDVVKNIHLVKRSNYNVVYNMLDGTVTAQGLVNGNTVDLTMTANTSSSGKRLSFTIEGTVDNDSAHLTLQSSTVNLDFADAINLRKLKAPASASAEFTGSLAQKASDSVSDPVSFNGQLNLSVDLSSLSMTNASSGEQLVQTLSNTLTSRNLVFNLMLSGSLSSESGDLLDSSLSVHGGETNTYALSYAIESPDLSAPAYATLSGSIDQAVMKPVSIELNYAGRTITASNDAQDLNHFSLQNQDGVSIDLNLTPSLAGAAGAISLDAATLASIQHQNAAYVVEFADGSSAMLNL
ncbi:MAG TPA: hypothetical protein VFM46_00290, partial [Pseudomonadales bacterium]|nr:hypothetical protein [Pseudomonadales bacterium]